MVSDEQLLEDLREFADEIGKTPTHREMTDKGPWGPTTYKRHFGTWNNALKKSGLNVNIENPKNVSEERLLEDLKEFADEIGETPTKKEMREGGPWDSKTYKNHFRTWNNALKEAGLNLNQENPKNVSDEQLLEDLKEFADEIGKTPTITEMKENGPWDHRTYENHFGTWNNALKEAGLEPNVDYDLDVKWDDSVTDYYGESYNEMKQKAKKRDDSKCRVCSSKEEKLNVHHIKPRRLFENPDDSNTLDNLITLCEFCHPRFENRWVECDPDEFAERAKASLNK